MATKAQISLSAQLRTRTEIRSGFGNLVPKGSKPAVFTSQRTRINFGYKWNRLVFGAAIQDVRVWGQDASTITTADGNRLSLHEGWVDFTLLNKADSTIKIRLIDLLSLKIGRQELNYDDARLIGNLDWAQQGRRHDMALLKAMHHGWQVDLGYAFNQNTDAFNYTGTGYVPGNLPPTIRNSKGMLVPTPAGIVPLTAGGSIANNSSRTGMVAYANPPGTNAANQQYKSFWSLYVNKTFNRTKISALFFNDRFSRYRIDSVGNDNEGFVYGRRFVSGNVTDSFDYSGSNSRTTYGLMVNHAFGNVSAKNKFSLQAAYYAQTGNNRDGVRLKAYHFAVSGIYQSGGWSFTPGFELLSGNDATKLTSKDNRFDPLYGTPHRHWGYMDYFYVGTGSTTGGLNNLFVKTRFATSKFSAVFDVHHFGLHQPMKKADGKQVGKKLGNEFDLLANYYVNRFTFIELGYSFMFATDNMPFAKGQASSDLAAANFRKTGTWFYAMLRFTPDFFYKEPQQVK
ncbi:hypothetical protein OI18_22770 [Flavihumibacter solisilvae]|uniref:Alginate export domain-containing protein n=1 Tax=Flavihumibacter solisilvae TaxID=1349421 RepID=A0A0C1KSV7_9BACT|nr:hypothetical protein OI18_22770 [Flavihumibacter solisilvae]